MRGIDISTFQRNVNYEQVKMQGIDFAIIRAGYGVSSNHKDIMCDTHYEGCKKAGIKVGFYYYSYAKNEEDAKKEALNLISFIKNKQFELPLFYDLEEQRIAELGKDLVTKMALAFCRTLKAEGYTNVGVYANLNWFRNYINPEELINEKIKIWLAQWNSSQSITHNATFKVDYLQYSNSGSLMGITGRVDLDYAYTSESEIENNIPSKKSNEEIAKEVWEGKWKNYPERKELLEQAGYNYDEIMKIVNSTNPNSKNVYIVKKGDNLTKIARSYGTTVNKLVKLNNIKNPDLIHVGDKIKIK